VDVNAFKKTRLSEGKECLMGERTGRKRNIVAFLNASASFETAITK
jgi:hypothetical protein